jgi:(R,R)-butanediol dehydrogenase/meso-butanediol dehydrogenase/diacetyl reductase
VPVVLDMLLDAVRPGGVIVNVSIWGHKPEVDMPKLVLKEIDLRGTIGYSGDHPATIALAGSDELDLSAFITAKIGLDELITGGFDELIDNNETAREDHRRPASLSTGTSSDMRSRTNHAGDFAGEE